MSDIIMDIYGTPWMPAVQPGLPASLQLHKGQWIIHSTQLPGWEKQGYFEVRLCYAKNEEWHVIAYKLADFKETFTDEACLCLCEEDDGIRFNYLGRHWLKFDTWEDAFDAYTSAMMTVVVFNGDE